MALLQQRGSSCGSAHCVSCSPSSSDSPLLVTPEPSVIAFSRQSNPGSPTGDATRPAGEGPLFKDPTQIKCGLANSFHDTSSVVCGDEVIFTTPQPESRARVRTVVPHSAESLAHNEPSQPLSSRFQVNPILLPQATAAPNSNTMNSDSEDVDGVAVGADAACYPDYTTPRKDSETPSYTNPLFDDSPCLSPWTQPLSAHAADSPLASGLSPSASSPTRRLFALSSGRHHSYRRRHLHRRFEDPRVASHSPDGATAAAMLAVSSLLCRQALRGRSGRSGLEGNLAGYLRRHMDGLSDELLPCVGMTRRATEQRTAVDEGRSRVTEENGDEFDPDELYDGAGVGATLDLMGRAATLQRQLVSRTEEVAGLRLQLEEAMAARDEMGLHLLESQEYIADLERRLAEEVRARNALAAQSQLLQEQLQEACESLHEHGQGQVQGQQLHGHVLAADEAVAAVVVRAPPSAMPMLGSTLAYTSAQHGVDAVAAACDVYGGYGALPQPAHMENDVSLTVMDPRDVEIAALRRENSFLTQRLITSSIAAAQAREQEEEARHKAHVLHELNQQYMDMVNTLSLELSLLRPNACGRTRGVFSLSFLRRAGSTSAGGDSIGDGASSR